MGGETIFTEDSENTLKTPKIVDVKEPTLNDADCGKKPTLTIPEVEGVNYIVKEEQNKYVVEAEINEGYINIDQNDKWDLNYQVQPCPIDTLPTTGNNALVIAMSLVTLLTITGIGINLRKNYLN